MDRPARRSYTETGVSGQRRVILKRVQPGVVIACASLFVALGSSAYATGVIDGHSIKSRSIPATKLTASATRSLKGRRGPAGSRGLRGPSGSQGASGANGANGVVGPRGATGAHGAKGATGAEGTTGPKGATGLTGPAIVAQKYAATVTSSPSDDGNESVTAQCPHGQHAVGGGYEFDRTTGIEINLDGPGGSEGDPSTSWVVQGISADGTDYTLTAYVLCS
jgi:hypothetical protein